MGMFEEHTALEYAEILRQENVALRAELERLESERRRDALDGQAALDEANNAVKIWEMLMMALVGEDSPDSAGNRIITIKSDLAAAVELLRKVVPPGTDWWCPTCQVGLSGSRVTFQEECDTCGTYLGDLNDSKWVEEANALLARLEVK